MHIYQEIFGVGDPDGPVDVDDPMVGTWRRFSRETADALDGLVGPAGRVAYGFRNALSNYSTVNMEQLFARRRSFDLRRIDPVESGNSADGYFAWVQRELNDCGVLLTSDRLGAEIPIAVERPFMNEAVQRAGLVAVMTLPAPDGERHEAVRTQV